MPVTIKYFLTTLLFLLIGGELSACTCGIYEDLNDATFVRYGFIAHIKFTEVQEFSGPSKGGARQINPRRIVRFKTIELYRGDAAGIAVEDDHVSSCGTFITPGEEWLVFGILDGGGTIHIQSCTPTTEFRNQNGEQLLDYGYPSRVKNWLDSLCQITPQELTLTGSDTLRRYFPNGQLAEKTSYHNGQRHGLSQHYYANGTLMDESHYFRGKPFGLRHHYLASGQLDFELEFDALGNLTRELEMPDKFQLRRCETIYQPNSDWETEYCYQKNGQLYSLIKSLDYTNREEKYYSKAGQLIHHLRRNDDWEETVVMDSLQQNTH